MARYYFDIHDGFGLTRDSVGSDCESPDAVKEEAMHILPAIARDTIPKYGDHQFFTVFVRNDNNITVYTAAMTFAGLWLGEEIPSTAEAGGLD